MTTKEIFEERKICNQKFNQLHDEIMTETDTSIAISKLKEMGQLADRMAELADLGYEILREDFKSKFNKIFQVLIKSAFRKK